LGTRRPGGYLGEYLVAQALKDETPVRVEWGPYDARGLDGTLVEIETAGYLQSWVTRRRSTPSWSFKSVRADGVWSDEQAGYLPIDPPPASTSGCSRGDPRARPARGAAGGRLARVADV